ncbi:MAG TPA: MFS transporter [Burkholderiales bacterium]|nr:MFS transporter [Burkholderiales bacterium]
MTQPEPALPLRLLARVLVPFACGYYFSYFFRTVNAVIWPDLVRDVGVDANRLGLLTSAYFLAFAAFQLPLGVLLDRFGPRRVNAGLLVVAACGALVFGAAEALPGLIAGRALIGLGVSGCLMASMKAFTLWFPMSRFATLSGWLLAAGGLGALSASAPVEALLRLTDWRGVFDGLAALTFATALLIFFVVPERDAGPTRPSVRELVAGFGTIYRDPVFWRVAGVSMTGHAAFLATQGLWVAPWLRDVAGFDRQTVAGALFAMAILTTAGFASTGTVSDALAKRGVAPLTIFKLGAIASAILMVTFALGITGGAVATWGLYAFIAPIATLSYAILTQRYDRALAGRVNTAVNVLVFVSAFAAQWGMGAIIGLWPPEAGRYPLAAYTAAFGTVVVLQMLALLPLLTLREVGPR